MKMKYVSIKPFYGKLFLKNKLFKINNGHNIFFDLPKKLKKYGVVVYTHDIKKQPRADFYVYCDVPYPWNVKDWFNLFTHIDKNILFCFESPLVNPFNHFKFLHNFFRRVYTWNDRIVDNKKRFKIYIPQLSLNIKVSKKSYSQKQFLVTVNKKKSAPFLFKLISPFKKDLYEERLKGLSFFDREIPFDFSLYGYGWDKPDPFSLKEKIFGFKKYKTFKGEIKGNNKIRVISGFKFYISFENASADGYITEKVFDCFKAGCIPIYYGASNINKYIPEETFIDFRDFSSYKKLLLFLHSLEEKNYNKYIDAGRKFLNSEKTQRKWFEKSFLSQFLSAIN